MQNYKKYLKPEIVSKLKKFDLKAKLVVEGFITGLHKSPYHGFSIEFSEHRQYQPGEPIRNMDWKVFGKTDRLYVKRFEEETNLQCHILVDTSSSMKYQSDKKSISKLNYANLLAASLSYLMIKQNDAAGLVLLNDKIQKLIRPGSTLAHLNIIFKELVLNTQKSKTKISSVLHSMAERLKRRGLIILISDLYDNYDEVIQGLKHLRYNNHEVIVFHLLDKSEIEFSFNDEIKFIDLETDEIIKAQSWEIRDSYIKKIEQYIHNYKISCRNHNIDYNFINTSDSFDKALLAYLIKRKRLK